MCNNVECFTKKTCFLFNFQVKLDFFSLNKVKFNFELGTTPNMTIGIHVLLQVILYKFLYLQV